MLWLVEGVPELGDDKEILAFTEVASDGSFNSFTSLFLVAVVAC